MQLELDYPFLIAAYLAIGLVAHNVYKKKFMPGKRASVMFTSYGMFSALGVFVAMIMLSQCNITLLPLVFIAIAPIVLRFFLCHKCKNTYNVTIFYALVIPLVVLFFPCNELAVIAAALAIGTAIGRLGCISAGCCEGAVTSCDHFHYNYEDPEQLVNTKANVNSTCCKPTVIYETIVQFIIAGLCLRFPAFAPMIFGIGTSALVFLSEFWRNRMDGRTTAIILLLLPLACFGKVQNVCTGPNQPQIMKAIAVSLVVACVLSNDLLRPTPTHHSKQNHESSASSDNVPTAQ